MKAQTKTLKGLFAVALLSISSFASANSLYGNCIGCHGQNGEGGVGPQISGQPITDLVAKLKVYRSGEEVGPMSSMMIPMAQGLSDEDIQELSEYISTL